MNTKELLAEHGRLLADVNAKVQALDDFVLNNDENSPDFTPKLAELQGELEVATKRWREFSPPSRFSSSWLGSLLRKFARAVC